MKRTHDYADFQPGDGTRYHLTLVPEEHGGIMVVCNNSSCWRYYTKNDELKFMFGNDNDWTRKAIQDYMIYWNKCLGWDN
jgi:hypothetical protein|tara:strand:+ start:34 stop:273 length:240 start_codon:yes stop_codon:yes gene_type:complete